MKPKRWISPSANRQPKKRNRSFQANIPMNHSQHDSHELPFWRKYIFSTDHKVIGLQYGITALCFLLFGFSLMLLMRWQLGYPGEPIPWIGKFLGEGRAPDGIMLPEFYNELGAMHGTIMVYYS